MWDQWAFPAARTWPPGLSYRCSIYGMDVRVSRYGGEGGIRPSARLPAGEARGA